MRSRSLTGWQITLLIAAAASMILLPLSQALADDGPTPNGGNGELRPASPDLGEQATASGRDVRFTRSSYVWPYASGPYYGDVEASARDARDVLRTPVGSFRVSEGLRQLPAELKSANKLGEHGVQYFVVLVDPNDLPNGAFDAVRSTVEGRGGAVIGKVPAAGLLVRLTPAGYSELTKSSRVVAIEPYHAAFKLDPTIGRTPLLDPTLAISEVYHLVVRLFPGESPEAVAQAIGRLGGSVDAIHDEELRVQLHRNKLADLASIEAVRRVWELVPARPAAEETTSVTQTGRLNGGPSTGAVPYTDAGIDGSGNARPNTSPQVLMVLDTGIQLDAGDLSNTATDAGLAGPAHRKVRIYDTTNAFGAGQLGDSSGCDTGEKGGFTHGHVVSSVALGAATRVPLAYGTGYTLKDDNGNSWRVDGVAPGAVLVAYDGQLTPAQTSCADPLQGTVQPGDLYAAPNGGSLGVAYVTHGARVMNLSWGAINLAYTSQSVDIDQFLVDKGSAMVVIAAGNNGADVDNNVVPDIQTLNDLATTKNAIVVGASRNADDLGADTNTNAESRPLFSSVGPATGNRVSPQLMAPGSDVGTTGIGSEYACLTTDNNQTNPVECARRSALAGTSFAAAAASGAALVVRDYFAQGFYPDGRADNSLNAADQVADVSGALVKATLIASANFMNGIGFTGVSASGDNLFVRYRFNNEQGYGRIELDNVLPLASWPFSPNGLIIHDGGIAAGRRDIAFGIPAEADGVIDATTVNTDDGTFQVCNPDQGLRVALVWMDQVDGAEEGNLVNDLNLEIQAPSGKVYWGNYFTDDNNRDGVLSVALEDCADINGEVLTLTQREWSIPACANSARDTENPHEAIFLSNDPLGNDTDSQIELGQWQIRVSSAGTGLNAAQRYAVVVSGGVCSRSAVALDDRQYVCNQAPSITVTEFAEAGDLTPTTGTTSARTVVQVLSGTTVVDTESGLTFTQVPGGGFVFEAADLFLTDRTNPESNNGALDVRDGNTIRVSYTDVDGGGSPSTNKTRVSEARVNCRTSVGFGNIVFAKLGRDTAFNVLGGCETNRRGQREFGAPDQYMDAGENISFEFAYASQEAIDLVDAQVELRCVIADTDSPATCRPGSTDCTDPNRANNVRCDQAQGNAALRYMTILNTPQTVGALPETAALTGNFSISMASSITCTAPAAGCPTANSPAVEMILAVNAPTSGKTAQGLAISRQTLNADEQSLYYSTDFPTGGAEYRDWDNNERINSWLPSQAGLCAGGSEPGSACGANSDCAGGGACTPTQPAGVNDPAPIYLVGGAFTSDYRFEAFVWSDLTAGGTKNLSLNSPWNFDITDGGFVSGITANTDEATIGPGVVSQWGEDKNFNGLDDKQCTNNVTVACARDADCPGGGAGTCQSVEQRDPADTVLNRSWNVRGGCGWVTKAPGKCSILQTLACYVDADCPLGTGTCIANPTGAGGAWHTGRIGGTDDAACLFTGTNTGQCQSMENVGGSTGQRTWMEVLETPEIAKVNGATHTVEFVDFQWNSSVGLQDDNVRMDWDVDNNSRTLEPADTRIDFAFLNGLRGDYDATLGTNNALLTDGYPVFAELCSARIRNRCLGGSNPNGECTTAAQCRVCVAGPSAGLPCTSNANCPGSTCGAAGTCSSLVCNGGTADGDACANDAGCPGGRCQPGYNPGPVTANCGVLTSTGSINGSLGNSRQAKNSCYFEGGSVDGTALGTLSLPRPYDDDIDQDADGLVDEFVTAAGPNRNQKLNDVNGPDMRFGTIEDIYGDTGNFFKAAIAIRNDEKDSPDEPDPAVGYGMGIDDVLLMWREFSVAADTVNCATNGQCAVIDVTAGNFFEGRAVVFISVLEPSPDAANDCPELPGPPDPNPDDNDCDNNGVPDVVITASSQAETTGEKVIANRVGSTTEYRGEIPISNVANVAGVLFIAAQGADNPVVTVSYTDNNDGTGSICKNNVDSNQWGRITSATTVFLDAGSVLVIDAVLRDGQCEGGPTPGSPCTSSATCGGGVCEGIGDGDSWADTNETVTVRVRVANLGTTTVRGINVRAATSSPNVACILDASSFVGDIAPSSDATAIDPFVFKVATVDRAGAGLGTLDDFGAPFALIITGEGFDTTTAAQSITLDLDLDAQIQGGTTTGQYFESFEVPSGLASFTTYNVDAGKFGNNGLSDGYRCQYHNPDDPDANSFGDTTCYLGGTLAQAERYHWQIDDPNDIDLGRGYTGTNSLYFGVFGPTSNTNTTPMGILEGAGNANPIHLGFTGAPPELTWKQQVSLLDFNNVNAQAGRTADRGVVSLQLANAGGAGVGNWIRLEPYTNVYDAQSEDNYFNCFFDPIDDGNDEDDITTRPPDTIRIYGPSSTCFPTFSFARQGETFLAFNPANIGRAQGPGLEGDNGVGTWVESKVSLFRFRGRSVRLRYMTTGLKAQGTETWEQIFVFNPDPGDDGWWIDDVTVTNTLSLPATVVNDTKTPPAAGCGATCNTVTASLTADPASLPAPGQVVTLSAVASSADRCLNGTIQYRFCMSADNDCADSGDTILRSFTDNPDLIDAPATSTKYAVDVRCSSLQTCAASTGLTVSVACPTDNLFPTVLWPNKTSMTWGTSIAYQVAGGVNSGLATYTDTLPTDPAVAQPAASSFAAAATPASGTFNWFVFRPAGAKTPLGFCNSITWGPLGTDPSAALRDAVLP